MSTLLVIALNIILIFIVFVILMNRIKKQSAPRVLDEYAKDVEALIVELNNAVDQAVNISEERVKELKRCTRKAERIIKDPKFVTPVPEEADKNPEKDLPPGPADRTNLIQKTKHLLAMGYTKVDVAKKLNITSPEVEFLKSLSKE